MSRKSSYLAAIAIVLVVIFAGFTSFAAAAPALSGAAVAENGIVETASVIGYLVCIAALALLERGAFIRRHWYFAVLLAALALRELDFHARFTSQGIFKTSFYVEPGAGVPERLIAVLAVALIVYVAVLAVRTHYRGFAAGLMRLEPVQVAVFCGLGLAAGSKVIDGLGRKLATVGMELGAGGVHLFHVLEEGMELGIPIMFLIAILAYARGARAAPVPES